VPDDQVYVVSCPTSIGKRLAGRLRRQRRCRFALSGDIALANAGALHDPVIAGLHGLSQLFIGHLAYRQMRTDTLDNRSQSGMI
jgi:hypothetical protein